MNGYSIKLQSVSKRFRKNFKSFRDMAGYILKISSPNDFWALKDITLSLEPGDSIGIIGKNGAGKSTLLKTIAGITKPTSGKIEVRGKIAGLIELGAGFHLELTGKENIFLYGAILGMSHREILKNFNSIVEFAELSDWLDTPVKFYSSGMFLRLGFAIVVHSNPDILLVDEALAVGDSEFQTKCLEKIRELLSLKKIIIIVSHDTRIISEYTTKTLLLEHGEERAFGPTNEIISLYRRSQGIQKNSFEKTQNTLVRIDGISIERGDDTLKTTAPISFLISYTILKDGSNPIVGINLYSETTHILSSHDTSKKKQAGRGSYSTRCTIPANLLAPGAYRIGVALLEQDPFQVYFEEKHALSFIVEDDFTNNPVRGTYKGEFPGVIRSLLEWETRE